MTVNPASDDPCDMAKTDRHQMSLFRLVAERTSAEMRLVEVM